MSTQPRSCESTVLPKFPTDPLLSVAPVWDSLVTGAATTTMPQLQVQGASAETAGSNRPLGVLPVAFLAEEEDFYRQYPWWLNAFPRLNDAVARLASELNK